MAAIPEEARVSTVKQVVEALKPGPVKNAQGRVGIKTKDLHKRRTPGYVRQGEWFFVPRPNVTVQDYLIHRNEPLRRGGGNPHVAEFLYRHSGETFMFAISNRRFWEKELFDRLIQACVGAETVTYEKLVHPNKNLTKLRS